MNAPLALSLKALSTLSTPAFVLIAALAQMFAPPALSLLANNRSQNQKLNSETAHPLPAAKAVFLCTYGNVQQPRKPGLQAFNENPGGGKSHGRSAPVAAFAPSGGVSEPSLPNPGCRSLRSLALGWELATPSGFCVERLPSFARNGRLPWRRSKSFGFSLVIAFGLHYLCPRGRGKRTFRPPHS